MFVAIKCFEYAVTDVMTSNNDLHDKLSVSAVLWF